MSDEKFMQELDTLITKHPKEGAKVFVEIESTELLNEFNAGISAMGRICEKVAINPHTNEIICVKWK